MTIGTVVKRKWVCKYIRVCPYFNEDMQEWELRSITYCERKDRHAHSRRLIRKKLIMGVKK